ncbi:hypothetical protein UPYG_G00211360 [Umbra pygmaea]|uniref:Uncharacterized protein n=1 Tax=Umbra pygmaea TaxID=75934 RepID=A0ABD0WJT6_UMBPY
MSPTLSKATLRPAKEVWGRRCKQGHRNKVPFHNGLYLPSVYPIWMLSDGRGVSHIHVMHQDRGALGYILKYRRKGLQLAQEPPQPHWRLQTAYETEPSLTHKRGKHEDSSELSNRATPATASLGTTPTRKHQVTDTWPTDTNGVYTGSGLILRTLVTALLSRGPRGLLS